MSVEVLDGATIVNFVEDEEAFSLSIRDRFAHLDTNHDGLLSYAEMLKELQSLRVFETHYGIDVKPDPEEIAHVYDSLFVQFDHDSNGVVRSSVLLVQVGVVFYFQYLFMNTTSEISL
ncbi:hypothetical protein ACFX15_044964 [Malus domestica]